MQVMYKKCCGIDVHKMKIVCCLRKGNKQEIREFSAETKELKEIAKWLKENKCEMIAMESTGSFWKPLWNIFEISGLNQILVNAKDMKNVPGKKTDIKDAEWISDLLQHGLLKASYIPDRAQRELREVIKYRQSMIQERTRELNRLQKMLEGANIKVVSKFSKLENKTCRGLIDYILELEENEEIEEEKIRGLINKNVKSSLEEIMIAMEGVVTKIQKELMKLVIEHINDMAERIEEINKVVDKYMSGYEENIKRLEKIPGIGRTSAQVILAEIGQEMNQFPTAGHLASWAGVCPGNNESAGKRRSGKTRKGNKILKSTLVQCANACKRHKDTFYYAQYQRILVRKGKKRATVAVAHSILISIYYMIKYDKEYNELGAQFYNQFNTEKKINSYIRKLHELGVDVHVDTSLLKT